MSRVVYYKDGIEIGSTPHPGPLAAARKFAKAGLIRHGADMARIIDVDGSGAEVDSVTRDAVAPKPGPRGRTPKPGPRGRT